MYPFPRPCLWAVCRFAKAHLFFGFLYFDKESSQDNGGAVYSKTDTFGLCRAGRLVRHEVIIFVMERKTQRRNGDVAIFGL